MVVKRGYESVLQNNPILYAHSPDRLGKRVRLDHAENQAFVQSVSSIHLGETISVIVAQEDEGKVSETRPPTPPLSDVDSDMMSPAANNKYTPAAPNQPSASASSVNSLESLTPTSSDMAMTTPCKSAPSDQYRQPLQFLTPAPISSTSRTPAIANTFVTSAPKQSAASILLSTPAYNPFKTPLQCSTSKRARPPIPDPVHPWDAPQDRWIAALTLVFRHVPTADMLHAAAVARAWRAAAQAPSSWETVDLHTAWRRVTIDTMRVVTDTYGSRITIFILDQCFGVKDEVLALIASKCPNLTLLSLVGCWDVSDNGIKQVTDKLPNLEHINLSSCRKITDLATVALANRCIGLKSIQLEYCKNLTDTSLAYILARCRLLRRLNLKRCTGISNSVFKNSWMAQLHRYFSKAFEEFRRHPAYGLRHLVLSDCFGLDDEAVGHIAAGCPSLEVLNLSFCSCITEAAIEQLAQHCPLLAHLDLSSCGNGATDRAVGLLLGCPESKPDTQTVPHADRDVIMYPEAGGLRATLRHISLRACPKVTDKAVRLLNDLCASLRFLDVMNCQGVSADVIERCTSVKVIVAGSTMGITPAKRPRLEEAPSTLKKHTSTRL